MKVHSLINSIIILAFAVSMLMSRVCVAQSPPAKGDAETLPTWQELGFDDVPEGYRTDELALIHGLDKGRGGWSFRGSDSSGDTVTPLEGRLQISGRSEKGMFPMWTLALEWPAEKPEHVVVYNLIGSPEPAGFELMLVRLGPMKPEAGAAAPKTIFKGTWNLESRTISWTEVTAMALLSKQREETDDETDETPESMASLEMVVAANGEITIQNPEGAAQRQRITGKTVARVGKPYFEEELAPRNATYDTYADVSDPRVKRCLPSGAGEIVLRMERGGHFARYKVSEADFHNFLNALWEANKDSSAHQRDEMHGEGEPVKPEQVAKRFERLGWKPLKNAVKYYSPSKASGAMTTYYYDRDAGIAYHDTGYW